MRDKLIELLTKKYDHYCDQCGVNKQNHYIENLADYLMANGVTMQQWIPVSERLPKPHEDVLVYDSTAEEVVCACLSFLGEWFNVPMNNEVTHWMPLPEAPKEGE